MLKAGQTLGHFQIVKLLGAGGMGEVYLAEDKKLKRQVALKILLSDYFEDSERKSRFEREARTAAGISHPNVTAIHDIGTAVDPESGADLNYIVMEFVEGMVLSDYLTSIGGDLKAIIRVSEKIAAGLAAAHKMNIVHRDIKADNIIIDENGEPKILDFGLAKPVSPLQSEADTKNTDTISKELTRAGKIIGTVSYMSPEQIRGEPVDARSDIFSFGILLYRLATGNPPFEGKTQVSTMARILETHQESPRLKNDKIPPELERIIDKCLQKDAADRYQDTRDLVVDLRNLRRQYDSSITGPTSVITDMPGQKRKAFEFRFSWKQFTIIIAVLIILGGIYWQVLPDSKLSQSQKAFAGENTLAILSFENKTGSDEFAWLETGLPEILLTDLSQSQSLDIISRDRVLDFVKRDGSKEKTTVSRPECINAARILGAKHALSGSYYRMGANIRIDARMEEISTGRIILAKKVIGSDPFILVDSLTEKIAQSLNLKDSSTTQTSVKTYTSSSPEAYKIYLAALEKFNIELFDEAIEGFERAIEIDSTFALPYMRIGMAHVFDGRPQQGARWFEKARLYQDRLPNWEATLLDIYANIWLDQKFDDAYVKMELLVRNHPNYKESRYIYGLMIFAFTKDTITTLAQMDTALQLDPQYFPVLSWYSNFLKNHGKYEEAKKYILKIRRFYPESTDPNIMLAEIYIRQDDFAKAANEYEALRQKQPSNSKAIFGLVQIDIHLRKFDEANKYLELIKDYYADDPYTMSDYYDNKANLANWQGKFKTGMGFRFKSLEQMLATGDSTLAALKHGTIATYYDHFDMPESTLYYSDLSYKSTKEMNAVNYPITLVMHDKSKIDTARAIFESIVDTMKSRFPSDLWPLINAVQNLFEASVVDDTAKLIESYLDISELSLGGVESNKRMAGILYILTGEYQKGKDIIAPLVTGEKMISSGYHYPYMHYNLGLAEEGLGNPEQAIKHFQEMLKYWGKPEIELKIIRDARQRLARLTM